MSISVCMDKRRFTSAKIYPRFYRHMTQQSKAIVESRCNVQSAVRYRAIITNSTKSSQDSALSGLRFFMWVHLHAQYLWGHETVGSVLHFTVHAYLLLHRRNSGSTAQAHRLLQRHPFGIHPLLQRPQLQLARMFHVIERLQQLWRHLQQRSICDGGETARDRGGASQERSPCFPCL